MAEQLSHTQCCVGSAQRPAVGITMNILVGVAQLARALRCERRWYGFEPHRSPLIRKITIDLGR